MRAPCSFRRAVVLVRRRSRAGHIATSYGSSHLTYLLPSKRHKISSQRQIQYRDRPASFERLAKSDETTDDLITGNNLLHHRLC
ncbi:hypothetical protein BT69DRAFT_396343 [Atractiella rhizophila]|nr:hypothetical protein BT69DRAFT_396343 [Atractiella rhizophila]